MMNMPVTEWMKVIGLIGTAWTILSGVVLWLFIRRFEDAIFYIIETQSGRLRFERAILQALRQRQPDFVSWFNEMFAVEIKAQHETTRIAAETFRVVSEVQISMNKHQSAIEFRLADSLREQARIIERINLRLEATDRDVAVLKALAQTE